MSTGKGKKRLRSQPVFYSEVKESHKILLTPSSWNKLKQASEQSDLSVSEYVEQWIRRTMTEPAHGSKAHS